MNTREIDAILSPYPWYGGTLARDELPQNPQKHTFYIVNSDVSGRRGRHWFTLYIGENKGEMFDSVGDRIKSRKDIENFLINNTCEYMYNTQRIQDHKSNTCGLYSIIYCMLRSTGYTMKDIINMFGSDLKKNDDIVKTLYNDLMK